MAQEYFLAPMIFDPGGGWMADLPPPTDWATSSSIAYSFGPTTALSRVEGTQAQLDTIALRPGLVRLCAQEQLQDEIGGPGVVSLTATLTALWVGNNWIAASDSWLDDLRVIGNQFLFSQRMQQETGMGWRQSLEAFGAQLNTQWRNLDVSLQNAITLTVNRIDPAYNFAPANNQQVQSIQRELSDLYLTTTIRMGRDSTGTIQEL